MTISDILVKLREARKYIEDSVPPALGRVSFILGLLKDAADQATAFAQAWEESKSLKATLIENTDHAETAEQSFPVPFTAEELQEVKDVMHDFGALAVRHPQQMRVLRGNKAGMDTRTQVAYCQVAHDLCERLVEACHAM